MPSNTFSEYRGFCSAILLLICSISGCTAPEDQDDNDEDADRRASTDTCPEPVLTCSMNPPPPELPSPMSQLPKFGIDTNQMSFWGVSQDNLQNLDIKYAISQGVQWVGRYIVSDGCGPEGNSECKPHRSRKHQDPQQKKCILPVHHPVSKEEVMLWHQNGIKVAFLWELHNKHRACNAQNEHEEFEWGAQDAEAAKDNMSAIGALHATIYFTVDFPVPQSSWGTSQKLEKCNGRTATWKMITNYFLGIQSKLGFERIGVYGSYGTVNGLLGESVVAHAWQQTFKGDPSDPTPGDMSDPLHPRAEVQQYDINAPQACWLLRSAAGGLDLDSASPAGLMSMW